MDPQQPENENDIELVESRSETSIGSASAKRVQLSAYSLHSVSSRPKTIKDSVVQLATLADLELNESQESAALPHSSFWELVMHRWKTLVGAGVLAMPYAFARSGWLVGICSVIIINLCVQYCLKACLNIAKEVCTGEENENLRFPEMMGIAFGSGPVYFKWLSRPWMHIYYVMYTILTFGACGSYILFIAVNMGQIYQDIEITWSIHIWVLLVYAAIATISAVPNMRRMVPFTVIAAFLQTIGLILLMHFLVTKLPPLADRDMTRPIEEMFIFIGIALFACGPVGFSFLLDSKAQFSLTAANLSTLLATLTYSVVGFFGYWKYGKECRASITFNLPTMWEFPQWIRLLLTVGVFLLFINNFNNFVYSIWSTYISPRQTLSPIWKGICKYLFRLLFITLIMVLTQVVPRMGSLMSLSGIGIHLIFGLVFVPAAEFSALWPDKLGRWKWRGVANIGIISFSILIAIPGIVYNTYILIDSLEYGRDLKYFTCYINASGTTSKLSC